MSTANRLAIKRVIARYRRDGIGDDYLAKTLRPFVGTGIDADDLDRLITDDLMRGTDAHVVGPPVND